jgi:hypothetical protein
MTLQIAPQGITLAYAELRRHLGKTSKLFCSRLALTFHETDEYTLYPAPIISVNKTRFTKHYFIGSKRIASRIGTGSFNNVYGINDSHVTAGGQDYAERMNQIETQREDYYKSLGIAPGILHQIRKASHIVWCLFCFALQQENTKKFLPTAATCAKRAVLCANGRPRKAELVL